MPSMAVSIHSLRYFRVRSLLFLLLAIGTLCPAAAAQSGVNLGSVNVGSSANATVTLTLPAAGTVGVVKVVTQGATGLDFTDAGTGTCKAGIAYNAEETCTVGVKFAPKFPGTRYGAAVLLDGSGKVLVTGYMQGTGVGPLLNFAPGPQIPVFSGFSTGIAVDAAGNVYIADSTNNQVVKETPSPGGYTQSTIGNGLANPSGVAVDGAGNVFVADTGNHRVLKETPSGNSYTQNTPFSAPLFDIGPVSPTRVAVDGSGNVVLMGQCLEGECTAGSSFYGAIFKETLSGGSYIQSTVGGVGGSNLADGLVVDGSGNIYANYDYYVYEFTLSSGIWTENELLPTHIITSLGGMAMDGTGNLYFTHCWWDNPGATCSVIKETLSAGTYTPSTIASGLKNLYTDIAIDGSGNVYLGTGYDLGTGHRPPDVLKIGFADPPSMTFGVTAVGSTSSNSPETVTLENIGNAPLAFPVPDTGSNPSIAANFTLDSNGESACPFVTSSGTAETLAASGTCLLPISFTPAAAGAISGTLVLVDNNLNANGRGYATQSILLSGATPGSQKPAALTSPTPGSVFTGSTQSFSWTSGTGVASYELLVGTIGVGWNDLYDSGSTTATSAIGIRVPKFGKTVYVQLLSVFNGAPTQAANYTFTEEIPVPAALTAPTGSTLSGSSQTFTWTPGVGEAYYELWVGTTGPSSSNVYRSTWLTATSATVNNIPTSGGMVYVRLLSGIGGAWQFKDYTFIESGGPPSPAALTSPTETTLTGSSQTFTWSAGVGVTRYELRVGTIGVASIDIYKPGTTLATSATVNNIPTDGGTVYVRLSSEINGVWQFTFYTFLESGGPPVRAALTAPTGATFTGPSVSFAWTAGSGVSDYELWVGTTKVSSSDVYRSGWLTATSATVNNIPTSGGRVFVRLCSRINGAWQFTDYTFTESGGPPVKAALTSPTVTTFTGSSQTFTWSAGTGVSRYALRVGTTGVGSKNIYDSGSTMATSATVDNIPTNGGTVYVGVSSQINGVWQYAAYTFNAQ